MIDILLSSVVVYIEESTSKGQGASTGGPGASPSQTAMDIGK